MSSDNRSISGKTLSTINVISSWVVNTFYNYLHQQAVHIHTSGRAASVTDAYKFIVRQYLDSFNDGDGYRRNLMALHKYYMDNTRYSSIPFDEWMKDILQQFVPIDYFSIMSNSQQDATLRGVLVNAVTQFSSDVVCTQILDTLIINHDNPSLVQIMKKNMSSALVFEREKLFQALFKSSAGVVTNKPMDNMKTEISKLIEENVLLKHKNSKVLSALKSALAKMKERDVTISSLIKKNADLEHGTKNNVYQPPTPRYVAPAPVPIEIAETPKEKDVITPFSEIDEDVAKEPDYSFTNETGDSQTVSLDIADFLNM
jgi:regulator of replication initiation timing